MMKKKLADALDMTYYLALARCLIFEYYAGRDEEEYISCL